MSIAAIGFEYDVLMAIIALVQTKGDVKTSVAYGGAVTMAATAFAATVSLFLPKHERASDERKYINERTEESN